MEIAERAITSFYGSACHELGISLTKLPRLRDGTARANAQRREPRKNHALSNETWRRRKPRYLANIWGPCIREVRAFVPRDYDCTAACGSIYPPLEASARFFIYFSQNEPYNTLRFRRILRLWDPPSCFCVTVRLLCGRHAEERAPARVRGYEFPVRQSHNSFPWRRGSIGQRRGARGKVGSVVNYRVYRSFMKENPSARALDLSLSLSFSFARSLSLLSLRFLSFFTIDCIHVCTHGGINAYTT